MIFGPDGAPLCTPIPHDQEGLLYAEVDFDAIGVAKTAADPAGHYARPDVARLLLNTAPALRVVPMDGCGSGECGCPRDHEEGEESRCGSAAAESERT